MTHILHLHPRYFGSELKQVVEKKLREEVEGTCSGRFGYIIVVVAITDPGAGVLVPTTGFAEFKITYKALLLKPFKNEVVDGTVTTVNKVNGAFFIYTVWFAKERCSRAHSLLPLMTWRRGCIDNHTSH